MLTKPKNPLELTWYGPRSCWKKKINGKVYYFARGKSRSDKDAYLLALAQLAELRKKLSKQSAEQGKTVLELLQEHGVVSQAAVQGLMPSMDIPPALPPKDQIDHFYATKIEMVQYGIFDPSKTLKPIASKYLELKHLNLKTNGRTEGGLSNVKKSLDCFIEAVGDIPCSKLSERHIVKFYEWLVGQIDKGRYTKSTAWGRWVMAKAFIRWLWETKILSELPRNLTSRNMTFTPDQPEVITFTADEIQDLLAFDNRRLHLVVLLGLNCGFTSKDCSDLLWAEVNLHDGTITRKRSKTRSQKTVPTVRYPLWPETLAALKAMPQVGERVMQTKKGKPVVATRFDPTTEKFVYIDQFGSLYRKHFSKLKPRTLKHLRKTTATILEGHNDFWRFKSLFLGHSAKTMADIHYVAPDMAGLTQALDWVRQQLRIGSVPANDATCRGMDGGQ